MISKNWFVKSIVFARDFPCFPCIGRFRSWWLERGHLVNRSAPSDSLDREWESRRTGCLVHSRSTFSYGERERERERGRDRKKERERQDFHATSNLSRGCVSSMKKKKRRRGRTRRTKECEVFRCSIEEYYFGGRVVFCVCTVEMFDERKWGLRGVARKWELITARYGLMTRYFALERIKKSWRGIVR